jgi:hypothetical protein
MIPVMSKKQINIILILDFDIRGFFGLGIHYKLFLTPVAFHLAISAVYHKNLHSLFCTILRSIFTSGQISRGTVI